MSRNSGFTPAINRCNAEPLLGNTFCIGKNDNITYYKTLPALYRTYQYQCIYTCHIFLWQIHGRRWIASESIEVVGTIKGREEQNHTKIQGIDPISKFCSRLPRVATAQARLLRSKEM